MKLELRKKIRTASPEFKILFRRVIEIKRNILNFNNDPKESLILANQDLLRGFKLLVHAEIEDYLEIRATQLLNAVREDWTTRRQINNILLRTMAYNRSNYGGRESHDVPEDRVQFLINQLEISIKKNNGITDEDVSKLFYPLGICIRQNHNVLAINLDNYGKSRGKHAHSGRHSLQVKIIKPNEVKSVRDLLEGLLDLDIEISNKLSSIHMYSIPI